MKLRSEFFSVFIICLTSALFVPPASAVIKVDLPVARRFVVADTVIIGRVAALDAEHRVVEVATVQRMKNDASPQTFRLQFPKTIPISESVTVGQPVVFLSSEKASIHLADTWLKAAPKADSKPTIWIITQLDDNAAGKTFPGTTASLVRVLEEMKAGKSTLIDDFEGKVFTGGVKEIAKLDVANPTAILSADVNGDGKPDLIVATPTGVKLFLATADGYTDATENWGLKGVAATVAASGDINSDGKIDLLLDGTLYLNDGQKFSPAAQAIKLDADAHVLAATLADLTGGGKLDAGFILSDGHLLVFKNPGQTTIPWPKEVRKLTAAGDAPQAAVFGDFAGSGNTGAMLFQEKSITLHPIKSDEPPIDFARLTGDSLPKIRGFANGLKSPAVTRLDINGDHRPDILITGDGASMVLVNRGFGAYLPDSDAGADLSAAVLKVLPASLSAIRARAAVGKGANAPDDLLLLSDDGHLFLASNPTNAK